MASSDSSKPPEKTNRGEEAVSIQSSPPADDTPDSSEKPTPEVENDSDAMLEPLEDEASEDDVSEEEKKGDDLKPGEIVGKYRIEKMIGRGGMATVYRALDMPKQQIVAVKVLKERFSSSLKALARFDREFLALESFNHPNIVRVLDKGVEGGINYFVMEYVHGASFSRLLKYGRLTLNTRAQILLQIAAALGYAQRKGIVHRDVKPDNVLIDRTGRAKLADFGIAQITKSQLPLTSITVASSFMGTADYMAPEQRTDAKSVDHRADIFSFGVMLYEAFTGKLPVGHFPLPSQLNPALSKRMDGIILKLLRQNPDERYQSIIEAAEDLKREMQSTGLSRLKARLALIMQTESWKRFFSLRAFGAVAVFGIVVVGLLWMFSSLGGPLSGLDLTPVDTTPKQPGISGKPGTSAQPGGTATGITQNMVLIPAGEFTMGTDSEFNNERPRREVYLDAFLIDKHEVSNAEYKRFVDATKHPVPFVKAFWAEPFNWRNGTYPPGKGDHPVVLVSWFDAVKFAKWAKKRLPTEAEWEKAARGTDGRTWPWGDTWDIAKCNIKESFLNSTQPVHMFPAGASPYGCLNMAGNVTEWTADWYDEDYYKEAPDDNPPGPSARSFKVARGGGWDSNINLYARTGYRHYFSPNTKGAGLGFRLVKDAE